MARKRAKRGVGGLGGGVRREGDAADLSQTVLANLSGVSRSWLAEIELGAEPRLHDAVSLATVLEEYGANVVALLVGASDAGKVGEGGKKSVGRTGHGRRALRLPEGSSG